VVICLERGADLHMVQLMPLPLTVSCFSKIQIGFIFLVLAYSGSPGLFQDIKRVCVCVCACVPVHCAGSCRSISAARARAQQQTRRTSLLLSTDIQTDGQTPDRYISNKCIAVRKVATPLRELTCHTGSHCYLPPGRGDIPALTPAEAGTRLSDPGGMKG